MPEPAGSRALWCQILNQAGKTWSHWMEVNLSIQSMWPLLTPQKRGPFQQTFVVIWSWCIWITLVQGCASGVCVGIEESQSQVGFFCHFSASKNVQKVRQPKAWIIWCDPVVIYIHITWFENCGQGVLTWTDFWCSCDCRLVIFYNFAVHYQKNIGSVAMWTQ